MYAEGKNDWVGNTCLSAHELISLEDRIAARKPALSEGLGRLKDLLGEEKFSKYIAPLQNLNRNASMVLLVAGNALERSLIERECIAAVKEAFAVSHVKVVG